MKLYLLRFFGLCLFSSILFSCSTNRIANVRKSPTKIRTVYDSKKANDQYRTETLINAESIVLYEVPDQDLDRSTVEIQSLVIAASQYLGTPYKYGGLDITGMDCSGLVLRSFEAIEQKMPRISREQANKGKEIKLTEIKIGDLLFFNTSGNSITHVGIVESVKDGIVYFIHASTTRGVMVSSLAENYWSRRFVKATRML
ncbi:C40 family peptidase [Weeksella virosa]|uniref:NLP/P60 protein n=1 Tax=Weeksella virosa (strain ATCC 43766 / DSM 16922 / JCM 21250 / CCUG 30538 / CDC 9751 / IAM 14551 / NBRC 16016 / NCTC 11634 / CL345/78) TaxID=865938 RepID=F0NZT8_WEEVC|nr:C40 family peptidase [Weeksella virosa]ADX68362.1 NLP/P60 protein [Weeksella virosa DSM 16922]MDK7674679.1 C40 family peptidase [Weeksella virosa]SUP54683.1 Probable endopeptidase Spr precursor [Weeksella virosa]VEH63994.1 Probable endopeptidase Spr precursor [Weeksella virosa]